jgi:hypothetical protein
MLTSHKVFEYRLLVCFFFCLIFYLEAKTFQRKNQATQIQKDDDYIESIDMNRMINETNQGTNKTTINIGWLRLATY